jgi:putative peptidoglycan lipid II flippase
MLCFGFFQTSDSYWAFNLGPSNLSILAYGQRLLIALGSLIIVGPSILLIPNLTQLNLIHGKVAFYEKASEVLRVVFSGASFVALVISIFSEELVKIIFQRGSFAQDDSIALSNLLPNMLLGMIFMLCVVILFRILFIDNKERRAAFIGLFCAIFYFFLSGIFSSQYGLVGITYSYITTWIVVFFMSVIALFWGNLHSFFNRINALFFVFNSLALVVVHLVVSELFSLIDLLEINEVNFCLLCLISLLCIISFILYFFLMGIVFRDNTLRALYDKMRVSFL